MKGSNTMTENTKELKNIYNSLSVETRDLLIGIS